MSTDALNFGSYNGYIWSAYALTFVSLVVMALIARTAANRELKSAQRRIQMNQSKDQPNHGVTP
jgi:heme exporter protein CcmD